MDVVKNVESGNNVGVGEAEQCFVPDFAGHGFDLIYRASTLFRQHDHFGPPITILLLPDDEACRLKGVKQADHGRTVKA
ncbi:hypothetical protein FHS85_004416 [Rhodoligotrophos appendicifer]